MVELLKYYHDTLNMSVGHTGMQGFPLNHSQTTQVLLEVDLRITPQQDCVNAYTSGKITAGMICAGPVARSGDTCQGDYVESLVEIFGIIYTF